MSYFLIFLAVILAGTAVLFLVGLRRRETRVPTAERPGSELANDFLDDGLSAPVPNLPPVLLPETSTAADVERVRFSVGLRGYRMDQVDQVLDQLGAELDARDDRIAELEYRLNNDRAVLESAVAPSADETDFQRPRHKSADNDVEAAYE